MKIAIHRMLNPVPRTYFRGFSPEPQAVPRCPIASTIRTRFGIRTLPFGQVKNIYPRPHLRGVLWYGVNGSRLATLVLPAIVLSGCMAVASFAGERSFREDSDPRSSRRLDARETARLRQVVVPLLEAMDRPCRLSDVRVSIISENDVRWGRRILVHTSGLG